MADATKIGVADATKMGVANARVANATQPLDYDYLRSETDLTVTEGMEEAEGMEEMELRSPLRIALSSSTNNLSSSVIFLVLVAAIAGNANLITFVINIPDICQFWDRII